LHYLAFAGPGTQEIAFDLDCSLGGRHPASADDPSPVYVSGLARAGTTLLLEAIHSTGAFATLTYRNMPFVTAPLLWGRMSRGRAAGENPLRERAHGDKVLVNYDSPEAFEEVFWLSFMKKRYVEENGLRYHDVDDAILGKYARFVANVVRSKADPEASRYLAKNNNNMLRIDAIRKAFPSSVIIVPFRNPLDHARSLQRQHESFLARHEEDPFSMRYMGWLGHFEFGRHFKPFLADSEAVPVDWEETRRVSFWIRYWKSVYQRAVETMAGKVVFFDYDVFCQDPKSELANLERKLGMLADSLTPYSVNIRRPTRYGTTGDDGAVSDDVRMVYEKLKESL
jgi:hypothetical protein